MEAKKFDFNKLFAVLTKPKEPLPPLTNVDVKKVNIKYIDFNGKVDERPIKISIPTDKKLPLPVVFVPHYDMESDALEYRSYIKQGWIIVSPTDFKGEYNSTLSSSDLIFNNAALYYVRHMEEVDKEKIMIVGGSAGGYMSLMLSSLQLGQAVSIANCPISNLYYNFFVLFNEGIKLNQEAFIKTPESERKFEMGFFPTFLPIPFLAMLGPQFAKICEAFKVPTDYLEWERFSPVGLAKCLTTPMYMTQYTSDLLVPIDQNTHKYTYKQVGESLPSDFKYNLLPKDLPGKLNLAYDEAIGIENVYYDYHKIDEDLTKLNSFPFDENKLLNYTIIDEGPVEGYGSHNYGINDVGYKDGTIYLNTFINKGAAKTNKLSAEKLEMFINRYIGRTIELKGVIGVDDTIYGSLTIYQKEVVEELAKWVNDNSFNALDEVFNSIANKDELLIEAYNKIKKEIK